MKSDTTIPLLVVIIFCLLQAATIFAKAEFPGRDRTLTRIAFGSCAKQWQHQTIWYTVLAAKPDLWLFLGDNIYGDTDGKTAWLVSKEQMSGEWNRLADKPEFQRARAQIPMME